jgi:hypothetical protein
MKVIVKSIWDKPKVFENEKIGWAIDEHNNLQILYNNVRVCTI